MVLKRRLAINGCLYDVFARGSEIERHSPREPGRVYCRAKLIRYASSLGRPMWVILRGDVPVAFCPEFVDASKSTHIQIANRLYALDENKPV